MDAKKIALVASIGAFLIGSASVASDVSDSRRRKSACCV